MPDFGSPVAQNVNVNPAQGIATISGLLGLKQQHIAIEQAAAEAYQARQSAEERQKLTQIPWKSFQNADGSFDVDKISKAALSVAPTTGQEFVGRFEKMASGAAETKKAYHSLNQQYQDSLRSAFGSWAGDPNAETVDLQKQLELVSDNAPESSRAAIKQIADHSMQVLTGPDLITGSPKTMAQQRQGALAFSRAGLGSSEVSGPGGVSTPITGTQILPSGQAAGTVQSRQGGGLATAGEGVSLGLSPAQLAQTITLPNGQVTTLGQFIGHGQRGQARPMPAGPTQTAAPSGQAQPGHPRTAAQDAPDPNAPKAVQDAYYTAVKGANDHVSAVRSGDENYGLNMRISDQIRSLSKTTTSGPGAGSLHPVMGVLGLPFGSDNVADYQLMGAYLDRQAATMRTAMGLPSTNEGIQTSQAIVGNAEYQAKALQDKNDLTQALSEGFHQYRNGLDRVAGFGGQASPQAVNNFKNAWTSAFDPNVYRGELAYKRSKAEGNKFVQSLDPVEAASLKQKRATLNALARGEMPAQ